MFSSIIFVNILSMSVLQLPDSHICVGKVILGTNPQDIMFPNIDNTFICIDLQQIDVKIATHVCITMEL